MSTPQYYKINTERFLTENGFRFNADTAVFEGISLRYWARDGILLFTNEQEDNDTFLIGAGEMRNGKYHCATFRWITYVSDLIKIYESVTGKSFYA